MQIIGAAFAAGLLSFFSPCILPLLPVYIGLLTTDASSERLGTMRGALNTIAFVLGISTTFFVLGLGAGALGRFLDNAYVVVAFGLIIFVFGLHLSGIAPISLFNREKRFDTSKLDTTTIVGAFLLGLGFSFGWTPCIGPILGTILALAAQQGSAVAGAGLMLVYSLGMSIPFLVITLASGVLLSKVRKINQYLPVIQRIGGALIAIMGLWMIFSQVHTLSLQAHHSSSDVDSVIAAVQGDDSDSANSTTEDEAWRTAPLEDVEGNVHTISEYEGKPLYIEFWGTWCPTCMDNFEEFQETAREYNEAGDVQVIGVTAPGYFGEMEKEDLIAWCNEQGVDFPVLMDEDLALIDHFALQGFPTSVFIDSSGQVQLVRSGVIEHKELEKILSDLQ